MIMTAPIYRFYLQIEDGTKTLCHPIYKNDVTMDYQLESGKRFFRRQLNGKFTFVREDFTLIMSATYEQTITLYMESSTDMGLTYTDYWQGTFCRTDLTIDFADHSITVQPNVNDAYKAVLDGVEKEFNLIELLPQTDRILLVKRPLIQTYVPGDTIVSCFIGGSNWEEDAEETTNQNELIGKYHFALNTILKEIELTSVGGLDDAVGTYTGRMILTDDSTGLYAGVLYEKSGKYRIDVELTNLHIPGVVIEWDLAAVSLERISDDAVLYTYSTTKDFDNKEFDMVAQSGSGMSGKMHADMKTYNVYARILCDVEVLRTATYKIPADDIVTDNRNYRRCQPYISPSAYLSNNYSDNPTKYGRRDDGTYFDLPTDRVGGKFYPIAPSTWRYASLWYADSDSYQSTERYGRKSYILRDAYEIASSINVLLQQIAPGITHEATTDYSEFLYATENPISGDKWHLYLTQKTNILKGEYTEPASKAVTTLQTILKMLENVFNCHWFIDDGKLRIEHISWFKNGGSYTADTRQVSYDLTSLKNIKNGKPWAFGQGEVTFDKQDLPERYQYGWMDETTEPFGGKPVEVNSPNTESGKIEDITIGNFTSDVDYMLLNPSDCSNDGFALLAAADTGVLQYIINPIDVIYGANNNISSPLIPIKTALQGSTNRIYLQLTTRGSGVCFPHWFDEDGKILQEAVHTVVTTGTAGLTVMGVPSGACYFGFVATEGTLSIDIESMNAEGVLGLPFVPHLIDGQWHYLQNGYLSMYDLQPKYLTYDMPSRNITVNGNAVSAKGMSRKAKQTVTLPADAVSIDTNKLIRTLVGFGEIQSLSLNLSSRIIKATVNYDNDIQ